MTVQLPIPDFAAARRSMIEHQLRPVGVTDRAVLDAMGAVPREEYVPHDSRPLAYADRSLALGVDRFMAAPEVLGQLLTKLVPQQGEQALVIGAGSGYSAAVLVAMGCVVTALECSTELAARARELGTLIVEGPLEAGHNSGAPYDLILIDGAVEHLPDAIIKQLADGGRLGAALIDRGVVRLIIGQKVSGAFGHISIGDAGVAALPGFTKPQLFKFER